MVFQKEQGRAGGEPSKPAISAGSRVISSRGRKVVAAGIILLAVGFLILSKTDPLGLNWASIISPILIVGSYVLIAIGIVLP